MDVKTILGLTSAIVGAGLVLGQDPSFEYPPVQPVLNPDRDQKNRTTSYEQTKRITVRFKQASAEEVMDWLSNQGINFVTGSAPKDIKLDLSVSGVSLDEVIDSVGQAMGGSFVRRGNTYIFQRGISAFAVNGVQCKDVDKFTAVPSVGHTHGTMENVPAMALPDAVHMMPVELAQNGITFYGQEPKNEKEMKAFREKMMKQFGPDSDFIKQFQKDFGNPKRWEEFGKQMEKMYGPGSSFEKNMKTWGEQYGKDMEKQFGPGSTFEKSMKTWGEQFGKDMEKQFGPGSAYEKSMKVWGEQFGKDMEKQFGPGSKFEKNFKSFQFNNGKWEEMSEKDREKLMKDLEQRMKEMDMKVVVPPMPKMPDMPAMPKMPELPLLRDLPVMPKMPAMPKMPEVGNTDFSEVAKTLTPAQREKNKRQGFLYWSDLTPAQQAQMGGAKNWTGNWSISYSKDKESFTVKSDRK